MFPPGVTPGTAGLDYAADDAKREQNLAECIAADQAIPF